MPHQSEYAKYISDHNRWQRDMDDRRTITTGQLDSISERFAQARQYIRLSGYVIALAFVTGGVIGALLVLAYV